VPPEEDAAAILAERQYWGRQAQSFLNNIGERRGYPKITDEVGERLGEPVSLIVRKRAPAAEENPEVALLLVLAPWLSAVLRIEYERWRELLDARRAGRSTSTIRSSGDLRSDREREIEPGSEFITRAAQSPGS